MNIVKLWVCLYFLVARHFWFCCGNKMIYECQCICVKTFLYEKLSKEKKNLSINPLAENIVDAFLRSRHSII